MLANAKALVVVLVLAWISFLVAKRFFADVMSAEDFNRRRNVWFVLTIAGFLLPSILLYVPLAVGVLLWAGKRDSNPAALYVLVLFAVPPAEFPIPQFLAVNHLRILSVVLLVPIALRAFNAPSDSRQYKLTWLDTFVILFGLWQLVLFVPYETFTNTLRRSAVYFLDSFIVFFALARAGRTKKEFSEIVAAFVMAACILSVLAAFEYLKGWLLYEYIYDVWGQPNTGAFLLRDGKLRAQVSTGHALTLGYVLMFAFGLSLFVRRQLENKRAKIMVPLVVWVGLLATYSRGPWFAAICAYLCNFAVQPSGLRKSAKAIFTLAAILGVVLLTPIGTNIINALPFVGTVDQDNVTYRQQLAEVSWRLIKENPWIGDPFFLNNMEEMRQGQGIIDLMNGYAAVALYSGAIGLFLYMGMFVVGVWRTFWSARRLSREDDEFAYLGYALTACMLATLLSIAVAGLTQSYYILAGFMAAYVRLATFDVSAAQSQNMVEPMPWQFTKANHRMSADRPTF